MGTVWLLGGGKSFGNDEIVCLSLWKTDGGKDRVIFAGLLGVYLNRAVVLRRHVALAPGAVHDKSKVISC